MKQSSSRTSNSIVTFLKFLPLLVKYSSNTSYFVNNKSKAPSRSHCPPRVSPHPRRRCITIGWGYRGAGKKGKRGGKGGGTRRDR